MEKILYAELNIVCIIACLLMYYNQRCRYGKNVSMEQRLFSMLILADIVNLAADAGNWVLSGIANDGAILANTVCSVIYYIGNPLICLLWLMYADCRLYQDRDGLRRRTVFYAIPAVINTFMALASPVTGWVFVVDSQNIYARGSYFWVMALASIFYLVLPAFMTLHHLLRFGMIDRIAVYLHLLLFPVILGAAVLLQICFFGLSVIWAAATLAILSVFISMQNADIMLDHLTGVHNRRRLDSLLQLRIRAAKPGKLLFLIMLDIDDFKKINDRMGHLAGDQALIQAAGILTECCRGSEDFIARYGGDEFVILGQRQKDEDVKALMDSIDAASELHGDYRLSFSMGLACYREGMSASAFLAEADAQMYRKKEAKEKAYEC